MMVLNKPKYYCHHASVFFFFSQPCIKERYVYAQVLPPSALADACHDYDT
jgi:hypothetical protein